MMIETTGSSLIWLMLAMALVTLATRWGGVYVMSMVPIGPRGQRFIEGMSGSVLIALLAPMAVKGDVGAQCGLLATALAMLACRKPMVAITAGVCAAAVARQVFV